MSGEGPFLAHKRHLLCASAQGKRGGGKERVRGREGGRDKENTLWFLPLIKGANPGRRAPPS